MALALCAAGARADIALRIVPESETGPLEVRIEGLSRPELDAVSRVGLAPNGERPFLSVIARDPDGSPVGDLPDLLGRLEVARGAIVFRPRYPPAPGLELEARLDGALLDQRSGRLGTPDLIARFRIPEAEAPATRVVAVEPGAGPVPANLLRIYVHFSGPMSVRDVPDHVRLLDAEGHPVELAFVDVGSGLWDPSFRRLTLFLHPGRVKRGVGPRETLGPALRPGESARLRIDAAALDAAGRPLVEPFEVEWTVGPDDREGPHPERWELQLPGNENGPLRIELGEPVDRAIAAGALRLDRDGVPVRTEVRIDLDGRGASLTPESGFATGSHWDLVVGPELEDPAGNRVGRRFEEPLDAATPTSETRIPIRRNENGAGALAPTPWPE